MARHAFLRSHGSSQQHVMQLQACRVKMALGSHFAISCPFAFSAPPAVPPTAHLFQLLAPFSCP